MKRDIEIILFQERDEKAVKKYFSGKEERSEEFELHRNEGREEKLPLEFILIPAAFLSEEWEPFEKLWRRERALLLLFISGRDRELLPSLSPKFSEKIRAPFLGIVSEKAGLKKLRDFTASENLKALLQLYSRDDIGLEDLKKLIKLELDEITHLSLEELEISEGKKLLERLGIKGETESRELKDIVFQLSRQILESKKKEETEEIKRLSFELEKLRVEHQFLEQRHRSKEEEIQRLQKEIQKLKESFLQQQSETSKEKERAKKFQRELLRLRRTTVLEDLVQGTCHNINSPLGVIIGNLELLYWEYEKLTKGKPVDLKKIKNSLDMIQEATTRIQGLTFSLLVKSRLDRMPEKQKILFPRFVRRELNFLSVNSFLRKKVDIDLQLEDTPKVEAAYGDLSQVFGNLIQNALYELKKVPEPKLMIKTYRDGNFAVLEVHDNGRGVPKELRKKIFEPFFTTKKGEKGTGTGIGLYSSKKLLEEYGATIEVDDSPLGGACFRIRFPIKSK